MKEFDNLTILGIDTSCDDTCIAILKVKQKSGYRLSGVKSFDILSNVVSSQVKLHAKYGGVWPFLAKREHQKNLPIVLKRAIKEARSPEFDLVAVTIGPGLEPCLWVGVNFAKDFAKKLKLPIVLINHIEAHILANFINLKFKILDLRSIFPAICLVVSGGHTQLILMKEYGNYKILGETRDDAAGECFDKVARILGLGYPGGPAIAAEAAKFQIPNSKFQIKLPRPMINQRNYDFSFAGLKTAVLYKIKDPRFKIKDKEYVQEMCREVQQAIIDVLIHKTLKAARDFRAKAIILGGGVAANEELRRQFDQNLKSGSLNLKFLVPPKNLCTDNGAMVAVAGYFNWLKGKIKNWTPTRPPPSRLWRAPEIEVNANLRLA